MPTASLIINSKSNRSPSLVDDLLHVSKRYSDIRPYVLDKIEDLDPALDDSEKAASDTLILCGGDGTMQATITSAINQRRFQRAPNYVALPCGMTNVIANDCGLQGSPPIALENFLWRRGRGELQRVERPLISMQLSESQLPIYGFFLGAGLFYTAVYFSRDKIQKLGANRSFAIGLSVTGFILKTAFDNSKGPAPLPAKIRNNNGDLQDQNLSIIMMTTLNKLSAGIFPFWGDGEAPMNITTINYPRRRLLSAAYNVIVRKNSPAWLDRAGYHSWKSDELRIRFDEPIVFDGEIYHANPNEDLIVKVSHKAAFLV